MRCAEYPRFWGLTTMFTNISAIYQNDLLGCVYSLYTHPLNTDQDRIHHCFQQIACDTNEKRMFQTWKQLFYYYCTFSDFVPFQASPPTTSVGQKKEPTILVQRRNKHVDDEILPVTRFVFTEQQELSDDDDVWNMLKNDGDSFLSDDGWDDEQQTATKPAVACADETPKIIIEEKQTDWNALTSIYCMNDAKPKVACSEHLFVTINVNFPVLDKTQATCTNYTQLSPSFSNAYRIGHWNSSICLKVETQILRAASILGVPNLQMVSYLMSLPQIDSMIFVEVYPKKKKTKID